MSQQISVYYIVGVRIDAEGKPIRSEDLGKFFTRQHADDHLASLQSRTAPWIDMRVEVRTEWAHEQHPAHQASQGRKAAWQK